jgi:hypothetical protein
MSTRKGSWPPRENGVGTGQTPDSPNGARDPGTRRGNGQLTVTPDGYYEGHESWHRAAQPDHVRKNHRSR